LLLGDAELGAADVDADGLAAGGAAGGAFGLGQRLLDLLPAG
jgi:hypothetical protein